MSVGSVNDQLNSLQNQINQINTQIAPNGMITLWNGSIGSIPAYWRLCNGANGTPDLRDRFVVGAGNTYGVGNTGGQQSVTLLLSQIPSHQHDFLKRTAGHAGSGDEEAFPGPFSYNDGSGTTIYTDFQGGSGSHENRPPYYALCFIMKVSFP